MVKKIGGPKGPKVHSSTAVTTSKVDSVKSVTKTSGVGGTRAIGAAGGRISPAQREAIFEIVQEEADKLFKNGAIAPEKRKQVEDAVKMAIDAGILDEEEIEKK